MRIESRSVLCGVRASDCLAFYCHFFLPLWTFELLDMFRFALHMLVLYCTVKYLNVVVFLSSDYYLLNNSNYYSELHYNNAMASLSNPPMFTIQRKSFTAVVVIFRCCEIQLAGDIPPAASLYTANYLHYAPEDSKIIVNYFKILGSSRS